MLDDFTKRLLAVFRSLIKKQAIGTKTEFANAAGIKSLSQFNQIEKFERNYPDDTEKRAKARSGLLEKYGVNPDYLLGKSEKEFLREPEKVERAMKLKEVEYNFRDKKEKKAVVDELESLQSEVKQLRERLAKYEKVDPNPDTNSDKQ